MCDEEQMFILNNQLRSKNSTTDVISLPNTNHSGTVFLCPKYIYNQGYDNNRMIFLFIHSVLHIVGYTHDSDNDFLEMQQIELEILSKLNLGNPYAE